MANENVRNLRDGTIQVIDGTVPPNVLEIVCEGGDLAWGETNDVKQIKDRGSLSHMRMGEEEPVTLAFSAHYKYCRAHGAEPLSPYEVFHQIYGAAAWTSTNICGDVFTLDVIFTLADPCATGKREVITFRRVPLPDIGFEEGDESSELSFDKFAFMTRPEIYRGTTTTTTTTSTTTTTTAA